MADQARELLDSIQNDPVIHLAVYFAFVNSMRAGEIARIGIDSFVFADGSMWLGQQLQRVSDESLDVLSGNAVIRVFPKQLRHSRSCLVLKGLKEAKRARGGGFVKVLFRYFYTKSGQRNGFQAALQIHWRNTKVRILHF